MVKRIIQNHSVLLKNYLPPQFWNFGLWCLTVEKKILFTLCEDLLYYIVVWIYLHHTYIASGNGWNMEYKKHKNICKWFWGQRASLSDEWMDTELFTYSIQDTQSFVTSLSYCPTYLSMIALWNLLYEFQCLEWISVLTMPFLVLEMNFSAYNVAISSLVPKSKPYNSRRV